MGKRRALAPTIDGAEHEVVDTSVGAGAAGTTVYTGLGLIVGVFVNTVIATAAVVIKDGDAAMFTIPVGAAAGSWIYLGDTEFQTSLKVIPGASSTGNITVVYRQYD